MRKRFTMILVLTTVLVIGCTSANDETPAPTEVPDPNAIADPQHALDAARTLWAANGGDDYDLTFSWQCFCGPDYNQRVNIEVRSATVEAGAVADTGVPLTPDWLAEYRTVEQLFDLVQQAIDENAAEIRATYAADGYPTEVWIDFKRRTIDEERGFSIHALQPT